MRKKLHRKIKITKQQQAINELMNNSQIGNFSSLSTIQYPDWNQFKQDMIRIKKIKQISLENKQNKQLSPLKIQMQIVNTEKKQINIKKKSFQSNDIQIFQTASRSNNIRKLLSLQMIHRRQIQQSPRFNQVDKQKKIQQNIERKIPINDFLNIRQKLTQLSTMKQIKQQQNHDQEYKRQKMNSRGLSRYRRKFYHPEPNLIKTTYKFV